MTGELIQLTNYQELCTFIQSPGVQNIATLLGVTGLSLRDLKGRVGLDKFKKKFFERFPEGVKTETQNAILSDSLLEVKDYIENNPNLDDKIFEEINTVLINGLSLEDILTRIYIKTLKDLNFIDLVVLKEVKKIQIKSQSSHTTVSEPSLYQSHKKIFESETCKKIPKELIRLSLKNLENIRLVSEKGTEIKMSKNDPEYKRSSLYKFISEFGEGLLIALNKEEVK